MLPLRTLLGRPSRKPHTRHGSCQSLRSSGPRSPTLRAGPSPPTAEASLKPFLAASTAVLLCGKVKHGEERGTQRASCPSSQLPSVGLPGRPLPPGSPGTAARPPPGLPELPLRPSEASAWSSGSVAWTRAAGPVTADGWAAGRLARARGAAGPWASPAAPTVRLTAVSTAGLCWRRGRHVYL